MTTRDKTISMRLSSDELAAVQSKAASYGMSNSEYMRYAVLNASPPPAALPNYNALVSTVDSLVHSHAIYETTIQNLASSDSNVAAALTQARAALGPREE
jgi:hypothetical protein